ncbi:hypothetical protein [Roseovarius nanhaiticus]|uniref:hypothetical protein n=1 Tax=Roseovarius nanhaiticus TaxID=573024 RepID=UPI002490694F|nr:hypothetical protein [Roseovarius nanhaiticus]
MKRIFALAALAGLTGCAAMPDWMTPGARPTAPVDAADASETPAAEITSTAVRPPPGARTAEEFDTTSEADKVAAAAPATGGRDLGLTIASLGAPGEPGFWLKTPLVNAPGPGRVVYPANGKSVKVDLIPLDGAPGAGSRMSLAALRVLEAPLTGLPELRVFALN